METAAYFARKHGLEQYLDRPAELNELILKLLVLQETMQREQARMSGDERAGQAIRVRRKAFGSFTIRCHGDASYRYAAETALKGSTATVPVFQHGRFTALMRQMGVPEDRIRDLCASVVIDDDTHCFDAE